MKLWRHKFGHIEGRFTRDETRTDIQMAIVWVQFLPVYRAKWATDPFAPEFYMLQYNIV